MNRAARAMRAAKEGMSLDDSSPEIPVAFLRELLDRVSPLSLAERQALPGLSAARADVFPAALATLVAMADLTGCTHFRHSWYSLRHGVAARRGRQGFADGGEIRRDGRPEV